MGLAPGSACVGERGHDAVAIDLPLEDESAGRGKYTDTVVRRRGERLRNLAGHHTSRGSSASMEGVRQARIRLNKPNSAC